MCLAGDLGVVNCSLHILNLENKIIEGLGFSHPQRYFLQGQEEN